MTRRALYLLAYDIGDDRRRARVLRSVRAFGIDGQYSAHECLFSPAERGEIWRRVCALADPESDRLLLLRLDPRMSPLALGQPRRPAIAPFAYAG